jgi:carboxypeptidase C (cathepsin A)
VYCASCSDASVYDVREKCEDSGTTPSAILSNNKEIFGTLTSEFLSDPSYPILGSIQKYLNRKDVMVQCNLHQADNRMLWVPKFQATNLATQTSTESLFQHQTSLTLSFLFAGDWFKPYHLEVPKILDRKVPILIYAGDADYICKYAVSLYLL